MEERRHGKFELFGLKWIPGFDLQFLQYYIGPKIDIGLIPGIRQACFIKVIETFETKIFDCFTFFLYNNRIGQVISFGTLQVFLYFKFLDQVPTTYLTSYSRPIILIIILDLPKLSWMLLRSSHYGFENIFYFIYVIHFLSDRAESFSAEG